MRMYSTCLNQLFVRVWPLNHDCTPCYPYQRACEAQYSSVHCFIIRTVRLSWIHFYPSQLGHNRRSQSQNSGGNFTSVTKILNKTEESCYTVSSLTAGTHYCISCIYVTLLCFPGSPRLWNMVRTRWNMKHAHRFHSRLKNCGSCDSAACRNTLSSSNFIFCATFLVSHHCRGILALSSLGCSLRFAGVCLWTDILTSHHSIKG